MLLLLQCLVSKHSQLSMHLGVDCWMLRHLGIDVKFLLQCLVSKHSPCI